MALVPKKKKLKVPATVRSVKIPIYPGTIYYVFSREDYASLILNFDNKSEIPEMAGYLGMTEILGHPETGEIVYLICVFDGDIQTLVHECGHATMAVCRHVDINPMTGGEEAYCYLLDWIFGQATPFHAEEIKKNKNESVPDQQKVLNASPEIGPSARDSGGVWTRIGRQGIRRIRQPES